MIDKADFERLDERYVKKDDCNDTQSKIDKRIDDGEKTLAVLVTKLNITIAILAFIAAPILAIAIKLLFGGIA